VGVEIDLAKSPVAIVEPGMGDFPMLTQLAETAAGDLEILRLFEGQRTFTRALKSRARPRTKGHGTSVSYCTYIIAKFVAFPLRTRST